MIKSVEGIYRQGRIDLIEAPGSMQEDTPVIVTFLEQQPGLIDLREHGIDAAQAAVLRAQLNTFAEDWDYPGMELYDDYEVVKTAL